MVAAVLLVDQAVKIWVKTQMVYGAEFPLFGLDWARFRFIENPGMAFGIEFGGSFGKLALSLFRIIAVGFLIYFLRELVRQRAKRGLLVCFALILAGAMGNIIDSAFYGLIFTESGYHTPATMFPPEGGYAGFLYGKVVDMLYLPMFQGVFPSWVPVWGGQEYLFFRPVFNFADAAISVGVFSMAIFHRDFFREDAHAASVAENAHADEPPIGTAAARVEE